MRRERPTSSMRALRCSPLALALVGCGCWSRIPLEYDDEASASTTGSDATASITFTGAHSPDTSAPPPPATSATSASTLDDSGADTHGPPVTFLLEPDQGEHHFECDIFEQDCPPGKKCVVRADDGGSSWNATRCVPIPDDPVGLGEPCHVMGYVTSGLDDCELGTMCWDVDPKMLEGICVAFCVGDESNPYCEDPLSECTICGDSCLPLCLPPCSPLEQDCVEGQACYPVHDVWECAPDASGEQGGYGDPCEFINVCDPGLVCLDPSAVPSGQPCEGAGGCCTEICDLSDPAGDLQCTGAAGGQVCQPWYEDGSTPMGYESVGVCALPA